MIAARFRMMTLICGVFAVAISRHSEAIGDGTEPAATQPGAALTSCEGILYPVRVGRLYGYIDQLGRMVIKPQYANASYFGEDGFAVVGLHDPDPPAGFSWTTRFRVINRRGEKVFEGIGVNPLDRGRFAFVQGQRQHFIGLIEPFSSSVACDSVVGRFREGLLVVRIGEKYGFINELGKLAIPPIGGATLGFYEGLACIPVNGKYGYIDHSGRWVIEPQYDGATEFREGVAVVRKGDLEHYINQKGERAIPRDFQNAYTFAEGLAAVAEVGSELRGYIDKTGKVQIPARFRLANSFSEGLAYVCFDDESGYIDHSGKLVIRFPQRSNGMNEFYQGRAWVDFRTKYGYIDRRGNWIWSNVEEPHDQ